MLLGNFFFDPSTGIPYYSGIDSIADRPLYLHGSEYPGRRAFNGGLEVTNPAFALPSGDSEGDAPRNFMRGFPLTQGNLAVRKTYGLGDKVSMQFKIESFNVFNHPAFGYIDPSFSDLLFGQASKMLDQSFGGRGAIYNQGGPRALQVSLKLSF